LPELVWEGIIVSGSASSTYEGETWIRRSEEFLRKAAGREVPIYGICFGHQLLAQAFGGKVEKCPRGWELGTVPFLVDPEARDDPLFAGLPEEFEVQQSHGDIVSELPGEAVCLGSSSHWPIQAFRLGDKIWGTQFHPEFTRAIMEDLVHSLTTILSPETFSDNSADRPVKERILSDLRESPKAPSCLLNFVKQVRRDYEI
jgi:GMP synthase (glutamine-hydrolysing)